MNTQVRHIPSGNVFSSRKEAKLLMGHSNYNKAIHNGQMAFITTYRMSDIIV